METLHLPHLCVAKSPYQQDPESHTKTKEIKSYKTAEEHCLRHSSLHKSHQNHKHSGVG